MERKPGVCTKLLCSRVKDGIACKAGLGANHIRYLADLVYRIGALDHEDGVAGLGNAVPVELQFCNLWPHCDVFPQLWHHVRLDD